MDFLIGDVQGCSEALDRLLQLIDFSPSRDHAVVLGDVVNRGPDSVGVVRRLHAMGDAVTCLLGNHDLHLLALAHGVRRPHRSDRLQDLLGAADRDAWLDWLRHRHMAAMRSGWLCVHAGVVPQWQTADVLALAAEVEQLLRGPDLGEFLRVMYGNEPRRWQAGLDGADRARFIINTLTRARFCAADGTLEFETKEGAGAAPPGYMPWFDVPGRATASQPVAFGHWSMLGLVNRPNLLAIDTGCIWGGALTAARIDGGRRDVLQVRCPQAQKPGL